jgi:hypothetical protein
MGVPMKLSDEVQLTRLIPSRIRTLMIANVVVALAMALFLNFKTQIVTSAYLLVGIAQIILVLAVLGIMVTAPLALVEFYLYRKKKGVLFQLTAAPPRPPREIVTRPRIRSYSRNLEAESADKNRVRTQLFESSSATDPVSRAALLLTVGDKLAQAGKKEAAQRCYRQILERFGGTPEAQDAARRLQSPAQSGPLIQ